MKVVCYWANCAAPYPTALIEEWSTSWRAHGFEPLILHEPDAQAHPRYAEMLAWVQTQPTVNDRHFENACWLRWLAFERVAPAVYADYDVINFGFRPEDVRLGPFVHLGAQTIYATKEGITAFIDFMPKSIPATEGGITHVSDLYARVQFLEPCVMICETRALTAPLVHFGNAHLKPEWRQENRWKAVEDLRKRRQ